ncbi:MAG: ABC transporter permease [Ferruginibacter sp.]|nr:ABC transporter permease [Chitinophagaceae bacterium]MBP6288125.1 ABC transporter permease [Ferruginibacter sp.]MBU9937272.1 ABC transporter permease [Ferruginibacter sp.]HQY12705.1 ABC transporter permease [Ferruginibacter sp.]
MAGKHFSFRAETWKRLKKNKGALFGLLIIVMAAVLSLLGYIIAPDNSPNADLQTVEIQAKKPGYTQQFLVIPDRKSSDPQNWLAVLWNGRKNSSRLIPINGYRIHDDSLLVNKYIDEDTTLVQYYSIKELTNNNPAAIAQSIITRKYWLGTDKFGRDILSRLIIGTRVSLAVGLIAVLISLTLGIILGALAGYYRGWVDELIMWLVNVTWSIPTLLLVFAITMAMGKGFWQIFIAVGLTMWVSVARLIRGQVMAIREMEYVQAARALGLRNNRIILRHILPNILGPVMVIAAGNFATAIIVEAGLSFLGIGIQPPQPSWGLMIKENYNFIITHNPMLALIPGFAIMLLVLAFNLLGNGLRDAVDVKET